MIVGALFYLTVVGVVALVFPWRTLVAEGLGTEAAFARAFGSRTFANVILLGAFLSLVKVWNGNFLAATRLAFAIGRRGLVHPALGRVHPAYGTPTVAIALMTAVTVAATFLGDAVLVPVSEVGSLAAGVGWLSACVSYLRRGTPGAAGRAAAAVGAAVSLAIVAMKVVPGIPGSFTYAEWIALAAWSGLGLAFWLARRAS